MISALSLPTAIRRRIDDFVDRKNPPSGDTVQLHNRRLYILPTRFGYLFAVMLVFLFLAAINYENSMAFMLTFMLTSLGIISLWQTHRNLLDVQVKMQIPRPVFAGEFCEFRLQVSHANQLHRYAIGIQYLEFPPVYLQLEPGGESEARLRVPAPRRGQFRPAGFTVFTRYPTGLFHAWGRLRFDLPILVYPRPVDDAYLRQSMVEQFDGKTSTSTIEGDDFAGLREHRVGESLRHISWKAYAQGRGLLTKTFQGQARPSLWIDWDQLLQGTPEERLSLMTALVLSAEAAEQKYGLRLPGITIEQGYGGAHVHICLQALATFRQRDMNAEFSFATDDANPAD